jgi:hypothetical protein
MNRLLTALNLDIEDDKFNFALGPAFDEPDERPFLAG